jgi:hypothetical protein
MSLRLHNGRLNLRFNKLLFYTEVPITILVIIYVLHIKLHVVSTSTASGICMMLYKTLFSM